MKRLLALMLVVCLWGAMASTALAAGDYIIADSDTRRLTKEELRAWSYDSLGYILNEIFARHGYCFETGRKYDNYFRSFAWYTPNADTNNSRVCYSQLTNVEWTNERLVKEVREEMRVSGDYNEDGWNYLDVTGGGFDELSGFVLASWSGNQTLPVYSAPSADAWRAANGKAAVSTNGLVWCAGQERGWALVMYETNKGGARVGWVKTSRIDGYYALPSLSFAYAPVTCLAASSLTDDPARTMAAIASVPTGATVTYLSTYYNARAWAYVETSLSGQTVRGFLPLEALDLSSVYDGADLYDK